MTTFSGEVLQVFHAWLSSPETYVFLTRFVGIKNRRNGFHNFIDEPEQEDLCHEFLLYLLERFSPGTRISPELFELIGAVQFRRVLELTWGRFIWQQQERGRSKEHNPRGYLHRRLREILRNNSHRFTVSGNAQKFLLYAPANCATENLPPFIHQEKEEKSGYAHWTPPPPAVGQVPEKYLFSQDWLADAAEFFWRLAMERTGKPALVPIRELCRYLADHYPWLNRPMRHESTAGNCLDQLAEDGEPPEERLQRISSLRSVAPLAAQLVATWSVDQQRVFALRLETPPVTLEEIAQRLGLVNHNKAYALYQKSVQSLRRYTCNWPGLPLAELPEEVAQTFIEEVKRLCKKCLPCP